MFGVRERWSGGHRLGKLIMVSGGSTSGDRSRELRPFELLMFDALCGDSFFNFLSIRRENGKLVLEPHDEEHRLCGYTPRGVEIELGKRDFYLLMAGEAIDEPPEVAETEAEMRADMERELEEIEARAIRIKRTLGRADV